MLKVIAYIKVFSMHSYVLLTGILKAYQIVY